MIGVGIDTGGTYTDAVIYDLDEKRVLCAGKALTTHHRLELGISKALDTLTAEALSQAQFLSLSTTLATNACVEGIGGRAKLLFINVDEKTVQEMYEQYGLPQPDEIYFIHTEDGRWQQRLERDLPEFRGYDSLAIVQIYAREDNARYEKEVRQMIREKTDIPCVCGYDLFQDLNVLRRGASALLNARLIPIIQDFIKAIKVALQERKLALPIVIVRSDGSMMSVDFALEHPVETLLCGPAASIIAGTGLTDERDALVVDMGGTTTDVAIIEAATPVTEKSGISIGNWKTFVKGLYVDTFGLGGDSVVQIQDGQLRLDSKRAVPLCVLADEYPEIAGELEELLETVQVLHSRPLHEFFLLQRDIEDHPAYSEEEKKLCRALKKGPLIYTKAAKAAGRDVYVLNTSRLEADGVIIRCGLTPTDAMHVKGDFDRFKSKVSLLAMQFMARQAEQDAADIADLIYELVEKKLYSNLIRILLKHEDPFYEKHENEMILNRVIEDSYHAARAGSKSFCSQHYTTKATLIGIGAPTHIFLDRTATLLGTKAVYPDHAHVANALGAVIGNVSATCKVLIKPVYTTSGIDEYLVYAPNAVLHFDEYEDARDAAVAEACQGAEEMAVRQGAGAVTLSYYANYSSPLVDTKDLFLEEEIVANAIGQLKMY